MPRPVHRRLSLLALVAMLLLALLPTLGRLAGTGAGCEAPVAARMDPAPMHMAHMTPAQHRAHWAAMAAAHAAPGKPAPAPNRGGHDCPYCPLLSGLAAADALPWQPHAPPAIGPWSVRAIVARRLDAPVPALGAQGPPTRAG